ncbi:MAG: bifunctional nuclease family protein [Deltaproteobacteria bacterium]
MPKEAIVAGVTIDPMTKSPIVVLKTKEGGEAVPIWIGILEANAIALVLEGTDLPRPLTHDLLKAILEETGTRLEQVEITDIRDNTFFALLHLENSGRKWTMDSRPSDAIAVALRCGARILVSEAVLAKSSIPASPETGSEERDKWMELLEKMDPEQFSKYKM